MPEPAESLRLRLSPYPGRYARTGVALLLYQDGLSGWPLTSAGRDGVTFVEGEWHVEVVRRSMPGPPLTALMEADPHGWWHFAAPGSGVTGEAARDGLHVRGLVDELRADEARVERALPPTNESVPVGTDDGVASGRQELNTFDRGFALPRRRCVPDCARRCLWPARPDAQPAGALARRPSRPRMV